MMALLALGLVLTGPVVEAVANPIGLSSTAVDVWNVAKWPVMAAIFILMVDVLYYTTPNVKLRGFHWVSPGAVLAIVVWVVASVLFAFYVANFSSYNKTYGALAGVIVFLVWMWLTNVAVLLGAELNAETERGRELEEGVPGAEEEIQAPYRRTPDEEEESAQLSGARRR